MSFSEARKEVSDDILHAFNVVGINANVRKHEEMGKETSEGTTLGRFNAGDFCGPGFGRHVVGPK